jgi:hypothetical protein
MGTPYDPVPDAIEFLRRKAPAERHAIARCSTSTGRLSMSCAGSCRARLRPCHSFDDFSGESSRSQRFRAPLSPAERSARRSEEIVARAGRGGFRPAQLHWTGSRHGSEASWSEPGRSRACRSPMPPLRTRSRRHLALEVAAPHRPPSSTKGTETTIFRLALACASGRRGRHRLAGRQGARRLDGGGSTISAGRTRITSSTG